MDDTSRSSGKATPEGVSVDATRIGLHDLPSRLERLDTSASYGMRTYAPILAILSNLSCKVVSWSLVLLFVVSCCVNAHAFEHLGTLRVVLFGLNCVYGMAFASLIWQVDGLIGARVGILPVDEYIKILEEHVPLSSSWHFRFVVRFTITLWKWACHSQLRILASHVATCGVALAVFNILLPFFIPDNWTRALWQALTFFAMYLLYLSFRFVTRDFLTFQWDVLILEAGIIAIVSALCCSSFTPFAASLCTFCFRLLVIKLMFCSGLCKYASGCPKWATNTAMHYHYWTQPLPNPISWWSYWQGGKKFQCIIAAVVECLFPFVTFGTWWMREITLLAFAGLMTMVYITGNYGFFNVLSLVLSLSLLDDSIIHLHISPLSSMSMLETFFSSCMGFVLTLLALLLFVIYVAANIVPLLRVWRRDEIEAPLICIRIFSELASIHGCNIYGLFATMTTFRHELVVEELHTIDNVEQWIELKFMYKPSDINRRPCLLLYGHMPRLDWRLWFLPLRLARVMNLSLRSSDLGNVYPLFWTSFLVKLCRRQPEIIKLLGPQKVDLLKIGPPQALRISLYDYRFTPPEERPKYEAFFPEGLSHLRFQDIEKLKKEEQEWEIGTWWMRRHVRTIDFLRFKSKKTE